MLSLDLDGRRLLLSQQDQVSRLAFSRQLSSNSATPRLARSDSSIAMPMPIPVPPPYQGPKPSKKLLRLATASRPMRRLALLLALNVAYSATELAIGLFTGRVGMNLPSPTSGS